MKLGFQPSLFGMPSFFNTIRVCTVFKSSLDLLLGLGGVVTNTDNMKSGLLLILAFLGPQFGANNLRISTRMTYTIQNVTRGIFSLNAKEHL